MPTAANTPDHRRVFPRINSLRDLTHIARSELDLTIYRAHLAGIPAADLIWYGELHDGELSAIIESFERLDPDERAAELAEPELSWRDTTGFGTYG